jgi:hypothetical protein
VLSNKDEKRCYLHLSPSNNSLGCRDSGVVEMVGRREVHAQAETASRTITTARFLLTRSDTSNVRNT